MALATTWRRMGSVFESGRSRLKAILWRLILSQIGSTLVLAALAAWFKGAEVAQAVAFGGVAVFVPAALSALRMGVVRAVTPQAALRTQVSAQALKWLGTVAIFGSIFVWRSELPALWVFVGFGAVQLAYWVALLLER